MRETGATRNLTGECVDGWRAVPTHAGDNKSAVARHVVCRTDQLVEGRGRPARVGTTYLAVFLSRGEVAVVENECVHVGSPLDGGAVRDGTVRCPWHGWTFDLRTGNLRTAFGDRPGIRVFPHTVEDGMVVIELDLPAELPRS